jgi:hypothetical protein
MFGVLYIATVLCAGPLWAQIAPSTRPDAVVANLIDRLGSDDFDTRESAQKKLADMGDAVEPQLRALLAGDLGDETRARINGVLHAIEEHILLGPSVITLHYKDAPLQTILEDFSRQARADLGIHRTRILQFTHGRTASINLDHAGFWETLAAISNATGLHPAPFNGESGMVLDTTDVPNIDLTRLRPSGAFAILAIPGPWNRGAMRHRSAYPGVCLDIIAEPKLHVLGPLNNDWLKQCLDTKGQPLTVSSYFAGGPWWWQLNTSVHAAPDAGSKVALMRGELKFTVQTRSDVFEIDDLTKLKNVTRLVNQTPVTLKQFTNRNGKYELEMVFAGTAQLNQWQWNRIQSVIATIQILDDQDQPLQHRGISISGGENLDLSIEYVTNDAREGLLFNSGAPRRLRWEVATETRTVSVPFELNEQDLP